MVVGIDYCTDTNSANTEKRNLMNKFETAFQEWVDDCRNKRSFPTPTEVKDWILSNLPSGGAEEILEPYRLRLYDFSGEIHDEYSIPESDAIKAISIIYNKGIQEEMERFGSFAGDNLVLQADNDRLKKENAELQQELGGYRDMKLYKELKQQLKEKEESYKKLHRDYVNINTSLGTQLGENAALKEQIAEKEKEIERLKGEVGVWKGKYGTSK